MYVSKQIVHQCKLSSKFKYSSFKIVTVHIKKIKNGGNKIGYKKRSKKE